MIRTKIVHGKVDILLIDGLPEDAKVSFPSNVTFNSEKGSLIYKDLNSNPNYIPMPPGNWQPVNWLDKVSEDEAKELVEDNFAFNQATRETYYLYKNYATGNWLYSAKESIISLVKSEVKIKNKYGERMPELNPECCGRWVSSRNDENTPECCGCPIPTSESWYQQQEWFDEEAKVWKNIYLLRKTN